MCYLLFYYFQGSYELEQILVDVRIYVLFLLVAHAKDALSLAKMQETTNHLKYQEEIQVRHLQ